jgi:hypothetical protein
LGRINPVFAKSANSILFHVVTCKIGTVIGYGNDFYLFRYDSPQLLKLKQSSNLGQFFSKTIGTNSFCIDDKLFIGSFKYNTLDSAKISIADFEQTNIKFYIAETNEYYLIVIPIVAIIGLSIFYIKKKKSIKISKTGDTGIINNSLEAFDEKELIVLNTILHNSERGLDTFIEQINQVLGIEKKNIAIQKRQRSDILISINTKLSLLLDTPDLLIQKKRLEFDKRSFCYFITLEDINKVKALIAK